MNRLALAACALGCLAAAWLVGDHIERGLLLNTARLVCGVELLTLPAAAVLAFLLARTNMAGRSLALMLCSALLFIPLYLQLCGWEAAFGRQGWHTFAFQTLSDPWLSGWRGAVFVHAMYSIPWGTLLMAAAFSQGSRQQEESALLDADWFLVFRRVTLPQLAGGVLLAAIWIFVITAGEMTVTNIYLVPTYAEDVYNFYAGNADAQANLVHYLPLLLFTASLVLCLQAVLPSPALSQDQAPYVWRLGNTRWVAAACVIALLLALVCFPLGNLAERLGEEVRQVDGQLTRVWSGTKALQVLARTPRQFRQEFISTGELAVVATGVALLLALGAAWLARRRPWITASFWTLAIIGIALPGPIIGLGVIVLLNHDVPPLAYLYDRTLLGPIIAVVVRVWPLTFVALWWALHTLDDDPLDAAALDGAGIGRKLLSIALPQRWPLLVAAGLAAFVVASGDVSASLLVLPPGPRETIARRMFGLIHVGADDQVAGVSIVCWLAYLALAVGVLVLVARRVSEGTLGARRVSEGTLGARRVSEGSSVERFNPR
jgi:iron(III) transport system permease protein